MIPHVVPLVYRTEVIGGHAAGLRMDGWTDVRIYEWTNGRIYEFANGRMDEWTNARVGG